jgi:hypothetical protein
MKKLIALVIAFAVLGLSWFYFTPHLALKSMKAAADAKNGAKLAEHVNFPVLRESLKTRLNTKLSERASKEGQSNPLSGLSSALFSKMVDPLVEKMVTPESLVAMMKGSASLLSKAPSDHPSKPAAKDSLPTGKGVSEKDRASGMKDAEQDISLSYESFNRFTAAVKKKTASDKPITLTLHREGFSTWKLVDVNFPL